MKIKWTNTYSGETGYVAGIDSKQGHFINTFDYDQAKQYATKASAQNMITRLINYGEGTHNKFEIVE